MNPLTLALRRPVTVVVLTVALALAGVLAWVRLKADIFPPLNLPVIYVCQPYGGMDPAQMEGLIANYYEYHFLYIGGIHHVESKNVQGVSLMKLVFHPGTDMAQAMGETVAHVNRSRAFMPPGTVPPFVMRFDTGSVPVGYLVLSSDTKTVGQIQDQALFKVRPMFAAIPGVSAPPPFGGNQRTVVVRADPDRLKAYNVSPDEVVQALAAGNSIAPSGVVRTVDSMPIVPVNALVTQPKELADVPVRPGVFLRDIAPVIEDASDIPTGYALVNGRRAVYILATKRAEASTLAVVQGIKDNLPKMQATLPDDIRVSFEFDQSPVVTNALRGVGLEAALGAILTGLAVLLFLRDWRSAVVVVLNIPLALIGSVVALWLTGQTVNLMTLGGLALAVGLLVDEATVEVENIHRQMESGVSVAVAVRRGNAETAVPRLLALLCVLAVFLPAFLMTGSARALFVPLALAVSFAMMTSYVLSSTLVPVLCVWLLRHRSLASGGRESLLAAKRDTGGLRPPLAWILVPAYLLACVGVGLPAAWFAGADIFPQADAGQFVFRLRAPTGTRIEQTEALTREALAFIDREAGEGNVALSLGYVGVVPPSYPINSVYLWMGGPEEAYMRVALKPHTVRVADLKRRLREKMGPHLRDWLAAKWAAEGVNRSADVRLGFEPADIVNEVMSFGSPTPVEVVVSGPKLADDRAHAEKVRAELLKVPSLRDVQYPQALDYPTLAVTIDRMKAATAGVTADDVAKSLVAATSSSRFTVPNYWRDPASGIGYQVQVEIPQARMNSAAAVEQVPVKRVGDERRLLRDVATVAPGTMPGELDRYNMRRLVSLTADADGEDLARVAARVRVAVAAAGKPPEGVQVDVRGQIGPLEELTANLSAGLVASVVVVLLMLTAYFQSVRLSLTAVAAVPAALAGAAVLLFATGSTVNLQSFFGTVMAVGVAVANAILLVTFAERERVGGADAVTAAARAVQARIRPILMTSAAMVAGVLPMAVGLTEGGDQTAPLGRAVVGGLLVATPATLFVLPACFALVMRRAPTGSPSLDPTDPESRHYRPEVAT